MEEGSHSGRVRRLGKAVYRKVSGVRIPPLPQNKEVNAKHLVTMFLRERGGFEPRASGAMPEWGSME